MTTRSSASTGRRTYHPDGGGGPMLLGIVFWTSGARCRNTIKRHRAGRSLRQQLDDGEYDQLNPPSLKLLATKLHTSPPIMQACLKATGVYAKRRQWQPGFKKKKFDESNLPATDASGGRSRARTTASWRAIRRADRQIENVLANKKPRSESSGVFLVAKRRSELRYCLGWPKSSGGNSIIGTSILTLLRSTSSGLSRRPVTVTGKAITSATMISCRPIQGSAPQ